MRVRVQDTQLLQQRQHNTDMQTQVKEVRDENEHLKSRMMTLEQQVGVCRDRYDRSVFVSLRVLVFALISTAFVLTAASSFF